MALPRYEKSLYFYKPGSDTMQQEKTVASVFPNNATYPPVMANNYGTNEFYIYSKGANLLKFGSPNPDAEIGKLCYLKDSISKEDFFACIQVATDKIMDLVSAFTVDMSKTNGLASKKQITFGRNASTSNCFIWNMTINASNVSRNSLGLHPGSYSIKIQCGTNATWNSSSGVFSGVFLNDVNLPYKSTDGNRVWEAFFNNDDLENWYDNYLSKFAMCPSIGYTYAGNKVTSLLPNYVGYINAVRGTEFWGCDKYTQYFAFGTYENNASAWTQNGTIDPTDPSDNPPPTPPPDPDPQDPTKPVPTPSPSDDIHPPGLPELNGTSLGFYTVYNPSDVAMRLIATSFWTPTIMDLIKQYFNDPLETIIGFGIVPVKPSIRGGDPPHVMFGAVDSGVSAPAVASDYVVKNCGSIYLAPYYNNYLDYEPYTKMSLFIPYIGEFDLNPDEVTGKTLQIYIYVNVITGDLVGVVTANGTIIYTSASNCFRELPLTRADYSQIVNTAVSAVTTIATAVAGGAAGAAAAGGTGATLSNPSLAMAGGYSGDVADVAGAAAQGAAKSSVPLLGDVMATKMHYHRAGQMGTGSGQLGPRKPFITILRPNLMLPDGSQDAGASNLRSFKGYPCNQIMPLTNASGYTVIEDCRLSIPGATDGEIAEALEIMKGGYIA